MTRSGWRRSLHQTSTISQPSCAARRAGGRRGAGPSAWRATRQLWHSTPTLRRGSARSSSASRTPRSSRTGYSSTSRMPRAWPARPWPAAGTSCAAGGGRHARRAASAAPAARPARRRHARRDLAQLVGRRRRGAARCRAPAPCGRCRPSGRAGRAWRGPSATGMPSTSVTSAGRSSPRVRWTVHAEAAVRLAPCGAEHVDGVVVGRSRRGRAAGPPRRGEIAHHAGANAAAIARRVERQRRRRRRPARRGHGDASTTPVARRPALLDAGATTPSCAGPAPSTATPCWAGHRAGTGPACLPWVSATEPEAERRAGTVSSRSARSGRFRTDRSAMGRLRRWLSCSPSSGATTASRS